MHAISVNQITTYQVKFWASTAAPVLIQVYYLPYK